MSVPEYAIANPPAEAGCVGEDLLCPRCGYNLRTLAWAGVCPECALPVRAALTGHGFRIFSQRGLKRLRHGLAAWVLAVSYLPVGFLVLGLFHLSTPIWLHDPDDIRTWKTLSTVLGYPLRISGIVNALLLTIAIWLLSSSGLRLRRWNDVLRAAMLGCLVGSGVQLFVAIVQRVTFKAGFAPSALPPWVWVGFTLLSIPVAVIPWIYLVLCVDRRHAPWLRRFVCAALAVAVLGASQIVLVLVVSWPMMFATPGALITIPTTSSRLEDLVGWIGRYVAPAMLPVQLAVVWLVVRRLQAAVRQLLREGAG